jgi:hypothetical protein
MTIRAKAEKNLKLSEALKALKNKCLNFVAQCAARLKSIFNSVGAASEETSLLAEDIPGALECIEKEVYVLDEVCWGLVLKCYELRTRQHKMLNVNVLRPSKHYFP